MKSQKLISNALRFMIGPARIDLLKLQRNHHVLDKPEDPKENSSDSHSIDTDCSFSELETKLKKLAVQAKREKPAVPI